MLRACCVVAVENEDAMVRQVAQTKGDAAGVVERERSGARARSRRDIRRIVSVCYGLRSRS